jgi:GDP-L-fucose synthase
MSKKIKIYIAGHNGMVGSAIRRHLSNQLNVELIYRSHHELDLTNQVAVNDFFMREKPDQVYLAAAKVGGIYANNTFPADFIYKNLMIQSNVINAAHENGVQKLLFLGSSCIYPRLATQPMTEEALLTNTLEPTNEPYAIAKIAGIKLCESYNRQYGRDYRSVMPTNLYGPGDNYHLENSHVLPALIRKFHLAKLALESNIEGILEDQKKYGAIPKDILRMIGLNENLSITLDSRFIKEPEVVIWGSGTPFREFLYVDDMAAASIYVMNLENSVYEKNIQPMLSHINVGCGYDMTIKEAANIVSGVIGYHGNIVFDNSKPDGPPRKLMNSSRLFKLGWKPQISFKDGINFAYQNYMNK